MKNILYLVATQYDNMGDLLINKCLVDELAKKGRVYLDTKGVPSNFKNVLLDNPNVFELKDISDFSLKGKGLLVLPFRKLDFDYFFKSPGPFGGFKTSKQKMHAFIFNYIFKVLKWKGIKSFLIGNDYMLESDFDKKMIKKYNNNLSGIFVRSKKNESILKDLQITKAAYSPDLCYVLNTKDVNVGNETKRDKVGISFRDLGKDVNQQIEKSVDIFINYFSEKGIDVEIFYQVERDRDFNKYLFDKYKSENTSFRNEVLTWKEKNFYLDKKLVLSNRLHVLLLGQLHNCVPFSLTFNQTNTNKINNIFDSVNMSDFLYSNITKNDLEQFEKNELNLIDHIKNVNSTQKECFQSILHNIFNQ